MKQDRQIVFPPFRLDPANQRLDRNDRVIALRPKTFSVLHHLAERPHQLVTKDELLDVVWSGLSVSDDVLKGCIREIREALGDDPAAPRFIETAHRRGYRFIATVVGVDRAASLPTLAERRSAVGREDELATLQTSLSRALRGDRQIVFVTGEPGIGKTTLVETFLERIGSSEIRVGRGQCLEHHGVGEAYLPILEALGRLCREPGGSHLVRILGQHAPTWLAQMPSLVDRIDLEAFQRQLVGTTPQRMLREFAEALEVITSETAVVLALEDLHWSDCSTLDLLASLARRREPARLLVIGTYRPEDVASRDPLANLKHDLQTHRLCESLELAALSEDTVADYLRVRFPAHRLPADVARLIHQRTDGNPLFIVSVVDDLVAKGAIAVAPDSWVLTADPADVTLGIPDSIRLMLEHRIEQLGSDDRRMLEAASVIGAVFSSSTLAAVLEDDVIRVEDRCDALARRRQVLSPSPSGELPDGTVTTRYRFNHALYRHVVYDRIPATRRSQLHRRIGNAAEQQYRDRVSEVASELAVHFEEGGDYEKAVTYFGQAAENAARRSAHQEAAALARRGLSLSPRLPARSGREQQMLALQMTLGSSLIATKGYSAPEVEQVYSVAREQCRALGATPELFRAMWGLGRFYLVRTPLKMAEELGQEMLRFAERANDRDFLLQAHNSLGAPLFHLGEFERANSHLEQGIDLYDPERHRSHAYLYVQDPKVVCLARSALALWCLGRVDEAAARMREALAHSRQLSHPFSEAFVLSYAAMLDEFRRDWPAAREHAEAAIRLSARQGFSLFSIMGMLVGGGALSEQEESDRGWRMIAESAKAAEGAGALLLRPYGLGMLARAYGKCGRLDEACATVAEALAITPRTGERFYEAELHRLHGELLVKQGGHESRAEACFRRAIEIGGGQQAKSWTLRAAMSLARFCDERGGRTEAHDLLASTYTSFTEGFESADLQDARALLGISHRVGS